MSYDVTLPVAAIEPSSATAFQRSFAPEDVASPAATAEMTIGAGGVVSPSVVAFTAGVEKPEWFACASIASMVRQYGVAGVSLVSGKSMTVPAGTPPAIGTAAATPLQSYLS